MSSVKHNLIPFFLYILAVFALLTVLIAIPSVTYADHITPNPCEKTDSLPNRTQEAGSPGRIDGPGTGFGSHVPVKDFEAEGTLKSILQALTAISNQVAEIEDDTNFIEIDTQIIRFYLNELCIKEYEENHTLQHDWAATIGVFVEQTTNWIVSGYDGNPLFVSNPYLYYQRIDDEVIEIFLNDIKLSKLSEEIKDDVIRTVLLKRTDRFFPDLIETSVDTLDVEKIIHNFTNGGGWEQWTKIFRGSDESVVGTMALALAELESRRFQARDIESEKLAWGRGFFAWEKCPLTGAPYTKDPEELITKDRRNCFIWTPAALIQEQTSLVMGSALRQMELADEYEEFISKQAFQIQQFSLNNFGLRDATKSENREFIGEVSPPIMDSFVDNPIFLRQGPKTDKDVMPNVFKRKDLQKQFETPPNFFDDIELINI